MSDDSFQGGIKSIRAMAVYVPAACELLRRHDLTAISDLPDDASVSLEDLVRTLWPDISSAAEFARRLEGDEDEDLETIMVHTPGATFLQWLCFDLSWAIAERTSRIP